MAAIPDLAAQANGNAQAGGNGNGQAPRVTDLTQPNGGYALPDDEGTCCDNRGTAHGQPRPVGRLRR